MFNLFRKTSQKPLKGYKITTIDRKQKYGIAADSLKMLKDKAADKLKVIETLIVFGPIIKERFFLKLCGRLRSAVYI